MRLCGKRFKSNLAVIVLMMAVLDGEGFAQQQVLKVFNKCPITLWIHFTGSATIMGGKPQILHAHDSLILTNQPSFGAGRCWAYYKDPGNATSTSAPVSSFNGFVEMSVTGTGPGQGYQNYNISYVDYASLPAEVRAMPNCKSTIVCQSFADWKNQLKYHCPTELVDYIDSIGIGRCVGSYFYCVQPGRDTGDAYCYKMQRAYHYDGLQIYGGNFPSKPFNFYDSVAGWERGTFAGDTNEANYFLGPESLGGKWIKPYNTFAKWVHKDMGAEVYAFANDDHQNKSGFQACSNSNELDITWCPCEGISELQQGYTPILRVESEKFMRYVIVAPNGRTVRSGVAASVEEVGLALRARLPQGVYFLALYGRNGDLAAKKRILVAQ